MEIKKIKILKEIEIINFDICEQSNIIDTIKKNLNPDEVYNLAAQSFVGSSFDLPIVTSDSNKIGTTRLLEAIEKNSNNTKFYQASSSEMFGKVLEVHNLKKLLFYQEVHMRYQSIFSHDDSKLQRVT